MTAFVGPYICIQITRYVDAAFPGFVECVLIDRLEHAWSFVEKIPVVTTAHLSPDSSYPQPGYVACTIISRGHDESDRAIVEIDTTRPWLIESSGGTSRFQVFADQLIVPGESMQLTEVNLSESSS